MDYPRGIYDQVQHPFEDFRQGFLAVRLTVIRHESTEVSPAELFNAGYNVYPAAWASL